jgi:hypothetical protein
MFPKEKPQTSEGGRSALRAFIRVQPAQKYFGFISVGHFALAEFITEFSATSWISQG